MKTKIGIPFGLALVMFIGVFTAMLALGVLAPSRAQAFEDDFTVMATDRTTGGTAEWTFTLMTEGVYTSADVTTLTFPTDFTTSGANTLTDWWVNDENPSAVVVTGLGIAITPATSGFTDLQAGGTLTIEYEGEGITNPTAAGNVKIMANSTADDDDTEVSSALDHDIRYDHKPRLYG